MLGTLIVFAVALWHVRSLQAVSNDDGKTFTKPILHLVKVNGSTANNFLPGNGMNTCVQSVWLDPNGR